MSESPEQRAAKEEIKLKITQDLKEEHQKIQRLFTEYEKAGVQKKESLAKTIIQVLTLHTLIEDEIIYPMVFQKSRNLEIFREAEHQHRIVKLLITQLNNMDWMDGRFDATFRFLGRTFIQQMVREEMIILPRVESLDLDFAQLSFEIREFRKVVEGIDRLSAVEQEIFSLEDVKTAMR